MSDGITIIGAEVENFRRLRVARVEVVPGKGLVRVTGETANGKTSLLKAIAAVLFGAGEIHPDSIREDAEKGRVTLRLSNGYTAERRITKAAPKGYLDLVGPDGPLKNAQTRINEWVGPRASAPLEFFNLSTDKQRDVLFSIAQDAELPAKLAAIREDRARAYAERTPIIARRRHLASIKAPEGERPEPVDTSATIERLREYREQQNARDEARREAESAQRDADQWAIRADSARARVEQLERELAAAREGYESTERKRDAALRMAKEANDAWRSLPDPAAAIAIAEERIQKAGEIASALEPWKRYEEARAETEQLRADEGALTERIEAKKAEEARLLDDAGIPIPGLSFGDDGEPLLNGRSLALASGRERIEVAVAVAMAANPDLKICLLDEANDLGLRDLERLDQLAKEHGFQIWAARLGLEGAGEIVVEDGEAWGRDDAAEALAIGAGAGSDSN